MGLCMYNKKLDKSFNIGYGGFFWLKHKILKSVSEDLAEEWEVFSLSQSQRLSNEFVDKLKELELYDLIMHSDCDGKLQRRELKRINKALSKINKVEDNWNEKFLELKEFIRETVEQGGIVIFC